jgi:hypothetical protein
MTTPEHANSAHAWNKERARINHDWLRVSFLTFLQAWRSELDQDGEAGGLSAELTKQLAEWNRRRPQLDALLADAEYALSPARGQENELLLNFPPADRARLLAAGHEEWLQHSGIQRKLKLTQVAADAVDDLVNALLKGAPVSMAGTRLYGACCKVSDQLSALSVDSGAT